MYILWENNMILIIILLGFSEVFHGPYPIKEC